MADIKDPLHQLIDVAVYAPIGLVLLAQKELPNLIASGKSRVDNQITLARFIGKLAVKRGRQELNRRLDAAESARNPRQPVIDAESVETSAGIDVSSAAAFVTAGSSNPGAARTKATRATGHAKVPRPARTLPDNGIAATPGPEATAHPAPHPSVALPIDGYDSLAASQVVVRLGTLTAAELDEIRRHEESHRARRTIIGKISQLQAR